MRVLGKHLDFAQVFVIDTDGTKITRMRAYAPYRPHGMTGLGLGIGHQVYRVSHPREEVGVAALVGCRSQAFTDSR